MSQMTFSIADAFQQFAEFKYNLHQHTVTVMKLHFKNCIFPKSGALPKQKIESTGMTYKLRAIPCEIILEEIYSDWYDQDN